MRRDRNRPLPRSTCNLRSATTTRPRLITVSGGENGGAANGTTNQITSVIQTVLAAQLVSKGGLLGDVGDKK